MSSYDASAHTDRFRPQLEINGPERQNRLTVLLRWLLLLPHFVVLLFLGIGVWFAVIIGWFCALVMGRLPRWSAAYLGDYLAWSTRVEAYAMLLTGRYPEFSVLPDVGATRIELRPGRLNRWAVLFRIILVIPAYVVVSVMAAGWGVLSIFLWLITLVLGRTPSAVFLATAAVVRANLRCRAYFLMVSDAYPLVGVMANGAREESPGPLAPSSTRPLALTGGGNTLLIVFIVVGVFGNLVNAASTFAQAEYGYEGFGSDAGPWFAPNAPSKTERAVDDTIVAYNYFVDDVQKASQQMDACQDDACRADALSKLGSSGSVLADDLADIDFPESAQPAATTLRRTGEDVSDAATNMGVNLELDQPEIFDPIPLLLKQADLQLNELLETL